MKQSISRPLTNSLSDADLHRLQDDEIVAAYMGSLPPKSKHLHGGGVALFFGQGELSIRVEIVQVAYKEEAFYVGFGATLGIDYWRKAMVEQSGRPVIENVDLLSSWKAKGLTSLFSERREVRLYGSHDVAGGDSGFFLKGIELISKIDTNQRVAFVASEDDPGDIIVLIPGDGYESELGQLKRL